LEFFIQFLRGDHPEKQGGIVTVSLSLKSGRKGKSGKTEETRWRVEEGLGSFSPTKNRRKERQKKRSG